jgi:hypothetical protein
MKTKQLLFILFAGILVLTGCKKEESTTLKKVQGKWSFVSTVSSGKINGQAYSITVTGGASDYIEFLTNGTFNEVASSVSATGTYSVTDTQVIMSYNGTTTVNTIITLTDTSLILNYVTTSDANNYQGETMTLKK